MTPPLVAIVGDVMNDVIVRPSGPTSARTDTPSRIARSPGGSGANQAAWLASFGVPVRFAGRVGAVDAEEHRLALAGTGVDARLVVVPDRPTGTVVALVGPDGERSMFTDRGANGVAVGGDLPADLLDGAALLHLSAYHLFEESTRRALGPPWAQARASGLPLSVDPASVSGLVGCGADEFFRATEGASLLLPNLDEGRFLSGHDSPEDIVATLVDRYPLVVLKLGPDGALAGDSAGTRVRLAAETGEVLDSTGAGDAFCAGFLAPWIEGRDLAVCLAAALATAARAVGQVGARPDRGPQATRRIES